MRELALFAALTLVIAPVLVAPTAAYADGIERPHQRLRATSSRPAPTPPAPAIIEERPETVTLPDSFFVSGGGVGADIGLESYWGGPVIIRGRSHRPDFGFTPRPRGPRR